MLKLAFVFPGQGSQYVGMGKEIFESSESAAQVFTKADSICGYKLSAICFEGPQDLLDQTIYSQPAIMVTSLACLAVAKRHGLSAQLMAGLSLGEYTALNRSRCYDPGTIITAGPDKSKTYAGSGTNWQRSDGGSYRFRN